jgi:hypothetical protein
MLLPPWDAEVKDLCPSLSRANLLTDDDVFARKRLMASDTSARSIWMKKLRF